MSFLHFVILFVVRFVIDQIEIDLISKENISFHWTEIIKNAKNVLFMFFLSLRFEDMYANYVEQKKSFKYTATHQKKVICNKNL